MAVTKFYKLPKCNKEILAHPLNSTSSLLPNSDELNCLLIALIQTLHKLNKTHQNSFGLLCGLSTHSPGQSRYQPPPKCVLCLQTDLDRS